MAAISLATEGVPVPMGIRQTSAEHLGGVVRVSREGRGGSGGIVVGNVDYKPKLGICWVERDVMW